MAHFASLGMFIIDEFSYDDGKVLAPQIGGGGTYATIGARIWLSPGQVGMIIDRGPDFPPEMERKLSEFGDMWIYREHQGGTTRALNTYRGDHRSFDYLTPRIRITPRDLQGTRLENAATLHFICSPTRASAIMSEVQEISGWKPTVIYEPIPDRCVPEELDALVTVLSQVDILSPNAEEALGLLSIPLPPTRETIEAAVLEFLRLGTGCVIIRSGAMGACLASKTQAPRWVSAFWTSEDTEKIVDVTGAGNSFLGGLAAGLLLENGDVYKATFYASVSASFIIEQQGLPTVSSTDSWNGDSPRRRLDSLKARH
ncbi:Ribokinase-like protein [Roridomyces roridus]|uniref:Ribokinase-like protein n=1 Tax=Roridomyces roridus TaxID=1738132 RepID=A0AAD7C4C6_9AGAR|nr:Ribokinase-like protein [Roridomyces roridus]